MSARFYAILLIASLLSTGCFSTTRINTVPAQADVVLDNKRSLGQTPVELEEMVWLWTKHFVTLNKPGYVSETVQIRSEGLKFGYAAVCVCTAGLLFPILLASSYPRQYSVTLTPSVPTGEPTAYLRTPSIEFGE